MTLCVISNVRDILGIRCPIPTTLLREYQAVSIISALTLHSSLIDSNVKLDIFVSVLFCVFFSHPSHTKPHTALERTAIATELPEKDAAIQQALFRNS